MSFAIRSDNRQKKAMTEIFRVGMSMYIEYHDRMSCYALHQIE